jgi:hypothetical protein
MSGLCQTRFPDFNYPVGRHLLLNKNMAYKFSTPDSVELDHFWCSIIQSDKKQKK